jgi:hypothetical protein
MKAKKFSIAFIIIGLAFLFLTGCEETARTPEEDWTNNPLWSYKTADNTTNIPAAVPTVKKAPKLTFEKKVHDFGNVSPNSTQIYAFKFKNTGTDILRITDVNASCGCTVTQLQKKEYAPGESGVLAVGYLVESQLGEPTKLIHIVSNDPLNPIVDLSVKAKITAAVDLQPRELELSLVQPNANCPEITLTSLDNQPFTVTAFASTDRCIKAEVDSPEPATRHTLKLTADMSILESKPEGAFEIGLSHPSSKTIGGTFSAPARFTVKPANLTIYQASPETTTKKVTIISNYGEQFDIEPSPSRDKIVSISKKTKISNGYELELTINPSASGASRSYTDMLPLKLTGGRTVEISCTGVISANTTQRTQEKNSDRSSAVPAKTTAIAPPKPKTADTEKKECPTCKKGPLLINQSDWAAGAIPVRKNN